MGVFGEALAHPYTLGMSNKLVNPTQRSSNFLKIYRHVDTFFYARLLCVLEWERDSLSFGHNIKIRYFFELLFKL